MCCPAGSVSGAMSLYRESPPMTGFVPREGDTRHLSAVLDAGFLGPLLWARTILRANSAAPAGPGAQLHLPDPIAASRRPERGPLDPELPGDLLPARHRAINASNPRCAIPGLRTEPADTSPTRMPCPTHAPQPLAFPLRRSVIPIRPDRSEKGWERRDRKAGNRLGRCPKTPPEPSAEARGPYGRQIGPAYRRLVTARQFQDQAPIAPGGAGDMGASDPV